MSKKQHKKGNPSGFAGLLMLRRMKKVHKPLLTWAFEFINIEPDYQILDVGFGAGNEIKRYLKTAKKGSVTGIDISSLCYKVAKFKNLWAIIKHRLTLINNDVAKVDLPINNFDFVSAFCTFRFWQEKEISLKKIYDSLKPNGTFIISDHGIYDVNWTINYLKSLGFKSVEVHKKDDQWIALIAIK